MNQTRQHLLPGCQWPAELGSADAFWSGRITQKDELSTFTFFSANLLNFMPGLPIEKHVDLYKDYRMNQWMNGQDVDYFEGEYPLEIQGEEALLAQLRKQQGLICTFHFGAYQLINYLLIHAGIPYVLVVADEVVLSWKQRYPALLKHLDKAASQGRFHLLSANRKADLRKMMKLVRDGHYLLFYVDGLEGISHVNWGGLFRIPFMGQHLHLPRGAAFLAYRFQLPLYPMLAVRQADRIYLPPFDPLLPRPNQPLEIFKADVLLNLFSQVVPYLQHWPAQWENWAYLQKQLSMEGYLEPVLQCPDEAHRYGLYKLGNQGYLLDKIGYRSYPLSRSDFNELYKFWCNKG